MDYTSSFFNGSCLFVFLPDLSLVFIQQNGDWLSIYVFCEEICDSAHYSAADYSYFLLSKEVGEELGVVF
jgi:hypothetical protein